MFIKCFNSCHNKNTIWGVVAVFAKIKKVKEWRRKKWAHKAFFYRILKNLMNTLHTRLTCSKFEQAQLNWFGAQVKISADSKIRWCYNLFTHWVNVWVFLGVLRGEVCLFFQVWIWLLLKWKESHYWTLRRRLTLGRCMIKIPVTITSRYCERKKEARRKMTAVTYPINNKWII